jgi:hypothetical protein
MWFVSQFVPGSGFFQTAGRDAVHMVRIRQHSVAQEIQQSAICAEIFSEGNSQSRRNRKLYFMKYIEKHNNNS